MKRLVAFALGAVLAGAAAEELSQAAFLAGFVLGPYRVVGAYPGSGRAYAGTAVLRRGADGGIEAVRRVGAGEVTGRGRIETATVEEVPILAVTWSEDGARVEARYLIHSDLDNYARLTGYVRRGEARGIEALFIDQGVLLGR